MLYIATVPNRDSPPAILLRESYRENGQVKSRTLANLTHWKSERIEALRLALRGEFASMGVPQCGAIFGVLFTLKCLADQLGITQALGNSVKANRALFLVLARIAHAGSRLSAVGWAQQHAVEDLLKLNKFDEDDLYAALDWIAGEQTKIEQRLYQSYVACRGHSPTLVLYDVTSSYLEGWDNELADFGYNRDGKKGKKQIVIGLMTADDGEPLAVRVFEGNTADPSTVVAQIELIKAQFNIDEVIMVGDRGMIKAKGKAALGNEGWHYITALTDVQIRTLLKNKILHPDLFDTEIFEVEHQGKRLILRRNEAVRHREIERREDKLAQLKRRVDERNAFVKAHARSNPQSGINRIQGWIKRHKLSSFVTVSLDAREITYMVDQQAMNDSALLDGCYTLETNVSAEHMNASTVDQRYRDLQKVERNFRALKTGFLEVRPIFLRKAARTKGHVFIAMLALKITRFIEMKLHQAFGTTDDDPNALTLDDALMALSRITYLHYEEKGHSITRLPRPDKLQSNLFRALGLAFPQST
jgi:transposase